MSNFFQTVFSNIGIADILDIVVVAFIVYKVLEFIRETRAEQLVKGLLLLAAAFFVSDFLNMNTLTGYLRALPRWEYWRWLLYSSPNCGELWSM